MIAFTDEDNEEAMLKAFELFALCMEAGPCNNCVFFDPNLQEEPCDIGCPNKWHLFDAYTNNGLKNRRLALDTLERMKNRQAESFIKEKEKIDGLSNLEKRVKEELNEYCRVR